MFYEGDKEPQLFEIFEGKHQTVTVMDEDGTAGDLKLLDVPDVKSRIQINYKPKK